jgi:hypothetical protein
MLSMSSSTRKEHRLMVFAHAEEVAHQDHRQPEGKVRDQVGATARLDPIDQRVDDSLNLRPQASTFRALRRRRRRPEAGMSGGVLL